MTATPNPMPLPGDEPTGPAARPGLRLHSHRGQCTLATAADSGTAGTAAATAATTALFRDRELLERWRAGDAEAGAALLDHYVAYVRRIALRLGVREADFEEFWHDLVLRVMQHLPTMHQRLRTSFAGYAAWQARDLVRRWRRRRRLVECAPEPAAALDEPALREAFWEALGDCSGRLPPRERQVFALRFLDGFDLGEVATRVGSNANAVAQAVFRLVRRLRDCLSLKGYAGPGDLA